MEITAELLRSSTFDLEIPNFEKWNPSKRKDGSVIVRRWIKFDAHFFEDPKIHHLTVHQVSLYIRSLLLRGSLGRPFIGIDLSWAQHHIGYRGSSVVHPLLKLLKLGLFEIQNVRTPLLRIEKNREEEKRREEKEKKNSSDSDAAPPPAPSSASKPPKISPPDLLSPWNEHGRGLVGANAMNASRIAAWERRWREKPDREYWVGVIKRLAASNFCRGENDRGWKADLDFLLKPNTHVKVSEGTYDRGARQRRRSIAETNSAANEALLEKILAEPETETVDGIFR